jgi:hypothetical protein
LPKQQPTTKEWRGESNQKKNIEEEEEDNDDDDDDDDDEEEEEEEEEEEQYLGSIFTYKPLQGQFNSTSDSAEERERDKATGTNETEAAYHLGSNDLKPSTKEQR